MTGVRPLTAADAAALARLHAACFDRAWPEADFAAWLSSGEGFGAIDRDRDAVAFALARRAGDDAEVLSVATLPAARGRGWGRLVLDGAVEAARARGFARMVLEVSVSNAPARALYTGAGFVEIGRRKGYYPEAAGLADALVLSRTL